MTNQQSKMWSEKITALEERITELKLAAAEELYRPVGCHPLVCALAALESLAWATKDAVQRFPTEEMISQPELL